MNSNDFEYCPKILRATDANEAEEILQLRLDGSVQTYDTMTMQLTDLIKSRHPDQKLTLEHLDFLVSEHLQDSSMESYGVWVYYPWSHRLVHTLDEEEFIELRTNRNHYKISSEEQYQLSKRCVGIVGLSVGQSVALTLALERGCGTLHLADFDHIDLSNLNRLRVSVHDIGFPKVFVAARQIAELDPFLKVVCFPQGWTSETADAFLTGVDLVVDECDSLDIKFEIRQLAKQRHIPVLMSTSERGMTDVERFDRDPQRLIFHGLFEGIDSQQLRGLTTEEKVPYIARLLDVDKLGILLRASLLEIDRSISTWPQLGSDVSLGGAIIADITRRIFLEREVHSGRYLVDLESIFEAPVEQPPPPLKPFNVKLDTIEPSIVLPNPVRLVIQAASEAPSGGNAQPWRYIYEANTLQLWLDRSRIGRPSLDFQCTASIVAAGASLENAVIASQHLGLRPQVVLSSDQTDLLATMVFDAEKTESENFTTLFPAISRRCTSRSLGTGEMLSPALLKVIQDAVESIPGAQLHLLTEPAQLARLGDIVGAVDRFQFFDQTSHQELMNEIRWTESERLATRDGIGIEDLELTATDQIGLQLAKDWDVLDYLKKYKQGTAFTRMARRAFQSSSAAGLIVMPGIKRLDFLMGGRAMQRGWLMATQYQIGFQPLSSICYLFARLCRGVFPEEQQKFLQHQRDKYLELFPIADSNAEILLFRLAKTKPKSRVSLRRSIEDIVG